jgi:hypothetical protein
MILIWILNPESQLTIQIRIVDRPSKLVCQSLTSLVRNLCINRLVAAIRPSSSKMFMIIRSVMVRGSLLSMVTSYLQETLLQVDEKTTIHSCSNGSFLMR